MSDPYTDIPLENLVGTVLQHPVLQQDQVLLLAQGTTVTWRIVELLQRRGIATVRVHVSDLPADPSNGDEDTVRATEPVDKYYRSVSAVAPEPPRRQSRRCRSASSLRLDEEIQHRGEIQRIPSSGCLHVRRDLVTPLERLSLKRIEDDKQREEAVTRVAHFQRRMVNRSRVDPSLVIPLLDECIELLCEDPDLFCMSMRTVPDAPYPARHSYGSARLAMALAACLNWSRDEIVGLGLGCLCHDAGMLRLSDRVYRTRARLDTFALNDLVKHSIYALDLVAGDNDLHESIKYIVYQMHERINGMGYPRGWMGRQIHPAARLAGLADAYTAMIADRPHRKALLPHQAILELIQEGNQGLWEPYLIKTLLRCLSLYPIGSFVELSDGRLGRSIRTDADDCLRPSLEVWTDPAAIAHEPGEPIDLRLEPNLTVLRAVSSPQMI